MQSVNADVVRRHQGPAPIDEGIEITQEQFDKQSRKNVERWVSAHIIPVFVAVLS